MEDKESKLFGVSLFVFLIIMSIVSIFVKDKNYISMMNYLAIPIFILTILIMINKYCELLYAKLANEYEYVNKIYSDYSRIASECEELSKENGKFKPDYKKYYVDLTILNEQSRYCEIKLRKLNKNKEVLFRLMSIPICMILLLAVFNYLLKLPQLELSFLNVFSLLMLVTDWLFIDWIVSKRYNNIAKTLNNIDTKIKEKHK